jgi:hypothetical protein
MQYTRVLEGEDKFGSIPRLSAVGIGIWGFCAEGFDPFVYLRDYLVLYLFI